MRFNRKQFANDFAAIAGGAGIKSPKEILQYVRMTVRSGAVELIATDSENYIQRITTGDELPDRSVSVLLHAQRMLQVLRDLPGESINLDLIEDGKLLVKGGDGKLTLQSPSADGFPEMPVVDYETSIKVSGADLKKAIRHTEFACSNDSTNLALRGIQFEYKPSGLCLVSTDYARMSVSTIPVQVDEVAALKAVVPKKSMSILKDAIDEDSVVEIAGVSHSVVFKTGNTTIVSQCMQGTFPNWERVVPVSNEKSGTVVLVASSVLSVVRQARLAMDQKVRGMKIAFSPTDLVATTEAADVGESEFRIPISYSGPEMTFLLDGDYLAEYLRTVDGESIEVLVNESLLPMLFTSGGYRQIIMPREEVA